MHSNIIKDIHFAAGSWPPSEDRPTLVFIHGTGGDHMLWISQALDLAASFNTVTVDLPGHGNSPGPGSKNMEAYAARVMEFIRSAGLSRPVPCGLSIGGGIVLQMLLDYPDELYAAILVNTGARLKVASQIFDAIANDYPNFVKSLPAAVASPNTPVGDLSSFIQAMLQTPAEVTSGDFSACNDFDVSDRLGEISSPVLVISAEDDRMTPSKYSDYLEKNIKGARRVHIRDAGHMSPLEKPHAVTAAISEFLESLA